MFQQFKNALALGCASGLLLLWIPAQAQTEPVVLPAPPWKATYAKVKRPRPKVKLRQVSARRNKIVDDDAWFAKNQLELPEYKVPNPMMRTRGDVPRAVPPSYRGERLVRAIRGKGALFLIYGKDFSSGRYLVVTNKAGTEVMQVLDFAAYLKGPRDKEGQEDFLLQRVNWVAAADDILYVNHSHRTYAKLSGGKNAYLTAIDPRSHKVLWRSRPLVANARNFVISGDVIVAGYGFTDEPDFLYLLDRHTGRVLQRKRLKTGATYILEKDGRLYVRTYNMNYVFSLK